LLWPEKRKAGILQEVARLGEQGDNLSARALFRLGGGPNAAFEAILVCKEFVFPRLPSFPGQCKAKPNSH